MCGVHWEVCVWCTLGGVDKECVLEVVNSLVWCAFIRKALGGVHYKSASAITANNHTWHQGPQVKVH